MEHNKMSTGTIKKVAGPLVIARGMNEANMFDVVRVSEQRLIGEWFRTCFEQAGATVELPCYFGVHDEGQTLDLKRNVWIDEEEKWD